MNFMNLYLYVIVTYSLLSDPTFAYAHFTVCSFLITSLKIIKGAGGSEVDFHFFVVSDRKECQLSETFSE